MTTEKHQLLPPPPYRRVSPRIGQLSRALRVAVVMPLRGTLDSCSSGARFQLGSGGGEDLDVVVELPVGFARVVDEAEAVREIALEQLDDRGGA